MPDRDEVAEDSVYGMLRFKNGSSITSFSTAFFGHVVGEKEPWGSPSNFGIQIFGTSGSLDLAKGSSRGSSTARDRFHILRGRAELESDWFLMPKLRNSSDAIREEREPLNDGKQGPTLMRECWTP